MLTFYYSPGSCSTASHIALEEAGADYRAVRTNVARGDQLTAAYRAINPKGRVPALAGDGGVLTENPAILAWVAQAHPDAGLAPTDPWGFAQAQSFNSYLCATVHVAHAHGPRGYRWADDTAAKAELARKVPETMTACFQLIETEMFKGPYVLGERFSVCDGYLFTLAGWLEADGVDPRQVPRVLEHRQRIGERPAVRKVLAVEAS